MSFADIATIEHALTSRLKAREQLIVAAGDEDVCSDSLLDWVAPLLAGIPGGRWMTCQLDTSNPPEVFARFRSGVTGSSEIHVIAEWNKEQVQAIMNQIPSTDALTIIVLDQYSSQMMTLLDGIATWLGVFELDHAGLEPLHQLFGTYRSLVQRSLSG